MPFAMRLFFFLLLPLFLASFSAKAQSVADNLPSEMPSAPPVAEAPKAPPSETSEMYTVSDVNVDVTVDTAARARDAALMRAERQAYAQLCTRLGAKDDSEKMSDDDIAALVKSFEIQSERLSAVRYIGVFTIRFSPAAVQKRHVNAMTPMSSSKMGELTLPSAPATPVHVEVSVMADSLAAWTQMRQRLTHAPMVTKVDTLGIGRGLISIDLSYTGSVDALKQGMMEQGLILRQSASGAFELYDNAMGPR